MILQVGPEEAGARLDVFLSEKTDLTRSAAQKLRLTALYASMERRHQKISA